MEACIQCRKNQMKIKKEEVFKEIKAFMKNPEKYYIVINPTTGFYKFEEIK